MGFKQPNNKMIGFPVGGQKINNHHKNMHVVRKHSTKVGWTYFIKVLFSSQQCYLMNVWTLMWVGEHDGIFLRFFFWHQQNIQKYSLPHRIESLQMWKNISTCGHGWNFWMKSRVGWNFKWKLAMDKNYWWNLDNEGLILEKWTHNINIIEQTNFHTSAYNVPHLPKDLIIIMTKCMQMQIKKLQIVTSFCLRFLTRPRMKLSFWNPHKSTLP